MLCDFTYVIRQTISNGSSNVEPLSSTEVLYLTNGGRGRNVLKLQSTALHEMLNTSLVPFKAVATSLYHINYSNMKGITSMQLRADTHAPGSYVRGTFAAVWLK